MPSVNPAVPVRQDTSWKRRKAWWWSIFAVITLCGLLLAGTGYRHGLPYIDFPDEMTIWTMGRATMDPTWNMFQPEYPPGLLVVSSTIQRAQIALGDAYINVAGTIALMRLTSVIACVITLMFIMLLAYRLAGPIAGTVAGLCWMVLPLSDYQAKLATIDAWVTAWFVLSIAAGIEGWYRKSTRWIVTSLLLAIIATLFKWQAAAALGMAGLALFTFWHSDRRKLLTLMALYLIIVLAFSYWVVFVHHALEGGVYLPGTKTAFPTPTVLLTNLWVQFTQIGPVAIFGLLPLVALILSVVVPEARRRLHIQMGLWTLMPIIVAWNGIISFNGAPVFERHYLGIMGLLSVLAGVGLALLWQILWKWLQVPRSSNANWSVRLIGVVIVLAVGLGLAMPWNAMLAQDFAMNADMSKPDRRAIFADWANATATDGPLLIPDPYMAAALQTVYGYRGRPIETPYNEGTSIFVPVEKITPELIAAKNIRYLILPSYIDVSSIGVPLTRLISYDVSQEYRGSEWSAYYVGYKGSVATAPSEKVVTFGNEVRLNGYSLSKQVACPGDSVQLQLLWSAAQTPARYYSFFLHMASDKTGELSMPINGQEPVGESRPTISWTQPNELLMGPVLRWTLPTDLLPGSYALWLGVFEPTSGSYLMLPDGKHYHVLTTIDVKECAPQTQTF